MGGVPVSEPVHFPFSAVVGQDEVKLALLLAAVDPAIGGVLLRGEKGSAKSTVARALASLLGRQRGAPFVELPVGATEDRLVGTLDLAAALTAGEWRFDPGLLAAAHGGVLYVDEVNLLPDHLVDVLLDVAASGVNRVEREGVSHTHPSRFVLIGSMNPEEGDLRPQLLDRFGLAVDARAPADPVERGDVVRRRLAFDNDPSGFCAAWEAAGADLSARLAAARPAALPGELIDQVSRLCVAVGAEGLRADLTICRAAAALAGWEGRDVATGADVRKVAPLALAHRRRRGPLDAGGMDAAALDRALDAAAALDRPLDGAGAEAPGDGRDRTGPGDHGAPTIAVPDPPVAVPDPPVAVLRLEARTPPPGWATSGRRSTVEGPRGRLVGDRVPDGPVRALAVGATVRAAVARRATAVDDGAPAVDPGDLRESVREHRTGNLIVLAVDASGSMGAERRMEAAKGAVLSLLLDAYQRRDRVAVVTFGGDRAQVVLQPTGSVEVARARLADLPTGGRTPLAAGIETALAVATSPGRAPSHPPLLVVVTDGRATAADAGADPVGAAQDAAAEVRRRGVSAVVVDAEDGTIRLGLARQLADVMGARYVTVPGLSSGTLGAAIRAGGDPSRL